MKKKSEADEKPLIAERDWNFDNVPDKELMACCYWEHARESAFIRETLRRYRDHWYCPGDKFADWVLKDDRSLERIQSIGYAAEAFMRGWTFKRGSAHQMNHPNKAN